MTDLKFFKVEDESRGERSFERDLMGLISRNPEIIHIMKIKHIREGDNYRSFSYGIFDFLNNEWIIYPSCSGQDSGGASSSEHNIMKLIKNAEETTKINLIEKYMREDEFYAYFEIDRRHLEIDFGDLNYLYNFKEKGKLIFNLIHSRKLIDAIAEMRKVIEGMLNMAIEENNLKEKDKIKDKYYLLVSEKILSKDYSSYLETFLRLANPASHRIEEDFWKQFPDVYNKFYFISNGINLGITLIKYLDFAVVGKNGSKNLRDVFKNPP